MSLLSADKPSRYEILTGTGRAKKKKKKKAKYGNTKTTGSDGYHYDSGAEAKRAFELELLLDAGQIKNLQRQVSYKIVPKQKGEQAARYVADFVYVDIKSGETVVEDVKGVRTPLYVLKRKLMLLVHGIRIKEIG